jgi:hypothetical protein
LESISGFLESLKIPALALTCKNEDDEKKRRTAHTQQESEDEKGDPGREMNDAA